VTFEKNSDMEVKVTQKTLSRAFVKETQLSKTCTMNSVHSLDVHKNARPMFQAASRIISETSVLIGMCDIPLEKVLHGL